MVWWHLLVLIITFFVGTIIKINYSYYPIKTKPKKPEIKFNVQILWKDEQNKRIQNESSNTS